MKIIYFILVTTLATSTCNESKPSADKKVQAVSIKAQKDYSHSAVFASGCFWCVEAVFESVKGVGDVVSGYAGGSADDANYRAVSNGVTDHAEAVLVPYDSTVISYVTLLQVFFGSQDPTTLNQQGPDRGRQYRSTIFYQDDVEKRTSEQFIKVLTDAKTFGAPITTTLEPLETFYPAEDYHQDFEKKNPNQGYVRAVSIPRLKKFQKAYPELLKEGGH